MQLNYHGIAYVYAPPAIATYDTETNGTFLGARFKVRQHQALTPRATSTELRFLGQQYTA